MREKINKESTKLSIVIASILIFVFSFSVIQLNKQNNIIETSENGAVSNKKIEWGIKRANNNVQPDVGGSNKKLVEEYGGICLGKDSNKYIYITFDAGYEAGYTEKILDVLKENDVKATFFITSHYLNTAGELVERMIKEGHLIGNHTVNHKSMPSITNEEIEKEVMKLHQAVYEKYEYEMKYIRPPKGEFSERTLKKCEELGYKTVMWSFAYCDWDEKKQPSVAEAEKMMIQNLHPGEIMLLHSNSKTNTEVLDTVIKQAKSQGYEFRELDKFE